jgi:hypothetical protein
VATGSTVSAFQVGTVVPSVAGSAQPGTGQQPGSSTRPLSLLAVLVQARLHADRKGHIRLVLRCPPGISCRGTVSLAALLIVHVGHGRQRHRRVVRFAMARASFGTHRGQFSLTLRLGRKGRALLRRHHRKLRVAVTIASPGVSTHTVDALLSG